MIMKECKRVLKDTGTMWINLGDSYMNNSSYCASGRQGFNNDKIGMIYKSDDKIKQKSLMLIPHRFAIRCVDELGLILRNDIIWAKRNGMPESVTDRFSKKHEFIFFFTKQQKYYFNLDKVRDKIKPQSIERYKGKYQGNYSQEGKTSSGIKGRDANREFNPKGKNPGNVSDFWDIPTMPSSAKHYATFNTKLIDKPIIAGCPEGGIILDPFCGSGTTLVRGLQLNRKVIGIDGSKEYVAIAEQIIKQELDQFKLAL